MPKKPTKKGSIFEKEKKSEFVDEPQEFLDEPEEHSGTHAEVQFKLSVGDKEEDVYSEEGRQELEEGDEVAPWEEGFAKGAQGAEHTTICAQCGKVSDTREDTVIEREFDDRILLFCSEKCAHAGQQVKKKKGK